MASGGGVTRGRSDREYADFCRLGGGSRVAIVVDMYSYKVEVVVDSYLTKGGLEILVRKFIRLNV